jgi:hypothetical protein
MSSVPFAHAVAPNLTAAHRRLGLFPAGAPLAGMAAEYVPDDGQVYLLGGYTTDPNNGNPTKKLSSEVLRYDPELDQFTEATPLSKEIALAAHAYVPSQHKIYLFGGLRQSSSNCQTACAVSDEILTYDVRTGDTAVAGHLTTARDRAAAVYHPGTGSIYVVGGVTTANAVAASASNKVPNSKTLERYHLADGVITTRSLPEHGYYLGAVFVPHTYEPDDFDFTQPGPDDHGYLVFVGTRGYVELYPSGPKDFGASFGKIGADQDTDPTGYVGGSTIYVPGSNITWLVGGFCNPTSAASCNAAPRWNKVIATMPGNVKVDDIPRGFPTSDTTHPTYEPQSQNDGAAVYVPAIDRVLSFGGYMGKKNGSNVPDWQDAPDAAQYRLGDDLNPASVFSVSPTYAATLGTQAPGGGEGPIPTGSPALVVGKQQIVTVHRADPNERFAIGIQSSYRPPGATDQSALRILPSTISGAGNDVDVTFTVPRDLTPGTAERAAGLCAVSLDRPLPPNCREVTLTTKPGNLQLTISGRDPNGTTSPLTRVTVQMLDGDGNQVEKTPLSESSSTFLSSDLATGTYTVNLWRNFEESDPLVYKPTTILATVRAGATSVMSVTLEGSTQIGPVPKVVVPSIDAVPGSDIGTFLAFQRVAGTFIIPRSDLPDVLEQFSAPQGFIEPLAFGPTPHTTATLTFTINGHTFTDTSGADGWGKDIDLTDVLVPGANDLQVFATDDAPNPHKGPVLDFTIRAVASPPLDQAENPIAKFDPLTDTYTTQGILPYQPSLRYGPEAIDLKLFKLYSQFRSDLQLDESFDINGQWQASGDGALLLQVMALHPDQFNLAFPFSVVPTYSPDGSVDTFTVQSQRIDLCKEVNRIDQVINQMNRLTNPQSYKPQPSKLIPCDTWIPVVNATIYDFPGVATVKFALSTKVTGSFLLQGVLNGKTWGVEEIRATPRPEADLKAAFDIDLLLGLAKGGAWGDAHISYDQPIVYRQGHAPPVFLDTPCVRMLVTGGAWVSTPLKRWDFGPQTFFDYDLPNGCFHPSSSAGMLSEAAAAVSFTPPDVMPEPVAATGPGTSPSSMRLWIEDANPTQGVGNPELMYAPGTDPPTTPHVLWGPGEQSDPQVAYIGPDRALAVWTQNDVTATQAGKLSRPAILRHQEIFSSIWNGTKWSTPKALTSNGIGDGLPVVAGDPSTGNATVAWVRDPDGDPQTKGDWEIVTRRRNGAGQWSNERAFGRNDGAADLEPAVAYNPNGTRAWLVWVHDKDGNITTPGDRRLMKVVWKASNSSWVAEGIPGAWPAGALNPSLVFSPKQPNLPLVAMVASNKLQAPNGDIAKTGGIGTENSLYAAWWGPGASGWDVQQIGNEPGDTDQDLRVEWPKAMLLPKSEDIALIVLRDFGGNGSKPGAGQAAIVEGSLGDAAATWGPAGLLTHGSQMVWQVSATGGDPNTPTNLNLYGVSTTPPSSGPRPGLGRLLPPATGGGRVQALSSGGGQTVFGLKRQTTGTNLALSNLSVSNQAPEPGDNVTVTADVTNLDVQPVSMAASPSSPSVDVYLCVNDVDCTAANLDMKTYTQDILFDQTVPFSFTYTSSGRPEKLTARLEFAQETGSVTDNQRSLDVGALPPVPDVKASWAPEGRVDVQWLPYSGTGAVPYFYRVFRGPDGNGPWTLAGVLSGTSFGDVGATAGQDTYRVEAYDGNGRLSSGFKPAKAGRMKTRLDVRGKTQSGKVAASGTLKPGVKAEPVTVKLFAKQGGTFVHIATKTGSLQTPADPDGDGVATSSFSVGFAGPNASRCRLKAGYGGDSIRLPSENEQTFAC